MKGLVYMAHLDRLIKKMKNELIEFHDELKKLSPQEIIDSAYEIDTKTELIFLVENAPLTPQETRVLLRMSHPLDYLYVEWRNKDITPNDPMIDTIKEAARDELQRQFKNRKRKGPER